MYIYIHIYIYIYRHVTARRGTVPHHDILERRNVVPFIVTRRNTTYRSASRHGAT